jgi:hypothetical protein
MLRKLSLVLMLFTFSASVFANIAPAKTPKPTKKPASIDTQLSISLDREAKEARLIIPRSQLKALRAELESLDNGSDDTAAAASTGGISGIQTIVSGAFISLAFVFAGFWFSRSGKLATRGGKAAAAGMIVFAGGAFATIVYGNAGPPPEARSITGKMFTRALHTYGFGSGKIKLEVSDELSYPKLIVPNPEDAKTPDE